MIERCASNGQRGWLELRDQLWPQHEDVHRTEMEAVRADPGNFAAFVSYGESGEALGFLEAALRHDYVNGTTSSPVAFIEGIYVVPRARKRGIGGALMEMAERWARSRGCTELASDALLENAASHAIHRALGFAETERVVYFRKRLAE